MLKTAEAKVKGGLHIPVQHREAIDRVNERTGWTDPAQAPQIEFRPGNPLEVTVDREREEAIHIRWPTPHPRLDEFTLAYACVARNLWLVQHKPHLETADDMVEDLLMATYELLCQAQGKEHTKELKPVVKWIRALTPSRLAAFAWAQEHFGYPGAKYPWPGDGGFDDLLEGLRSLKKDGLRKPSRVAAALEEELTHLRGQLRNILRQLDQDYRVYTEKALSALEAGEAAQASQLASRRRAIKALEEHLKTALDLADGPRAQTEGGADAD